MESWIREVFEVNDDGWEHEEGNDPAFAFDGDSGRVEARLSAFLATYGEVSTPPTLALLKACDPEDQSGWHRHFEAWAEQELIEP